MIRALEEHLAAWIEQQMNGLAAECGLYGQTVAVAGALPPPAGRPAAEDPVRVQVWVTGLLPAHPEQGLASIGRGHAVQAQARLALRITGSAASLPAAAGREFTPAAAHTARVDLVALTLLALLREQTVPAPDGFVTPPAPAGTAAAREGTRRVELTWGPFAAGEPTITTGARRQWDVELTTACTFRLSPAPLEGGRILQIQARSGSEESPGALETATYAAAEAIPLDYFAGLTPGLRAELAQQGIATLGDLGRLGTAGVMSLAQGLTQASGEQRSLLNMLAAVSALRQTAALHRLPYVVQPDVYALPARALLDPTPQEKALLSLSVLGKERVMQLTLTAMPIAFALKEERRITVTLGMLLNL